MLDKIRIPWYHEFIDSENLELDHLHRGSGLEVVGSGWKWLEDEDTEELSKRSGAWLQVALLSGWHWDRCSGLWMWKLLCFINRLPELSLLDGIFFCVEKVDFIGWLSLIPDSKLPNMWYNRSVATFLQQETPGATNIWGMELPNLFIGYCFHRQCLHVHSGPALDAEPCPTSRQLGVSTACTGIVSQ